MDNKWINMGDRNFWEYGRLIRRHWPDKEGEYDVIVCDPSDQQGKYVVACCYVNINDAWIDRKTVMNFSDIRQIANEGDKIDFALACISYYGIHEFQPVFPDCVYGNSLADPAVSQKDAYDWLLGYEVTGQKCKADSDGLIYDLNRKSKEY